LSNLTYLVEPKPGLSNARNIGTAAALGRIVAFIDDDARACPSSAKELLDAHAAFEGRAGIVGGPIVPRWTNEKPAWMDKPLLGYLSSIWVRSYVSCPLENGLPVATFRSTGHL
jgi:glucosyl-dolichyl phosphate glucuronosyltransferase